MDEDDEAPTPLRRPEIVRAVDDLANLPTNFDTLFPRAYYAHQLRLAGYDWAQVADKLHYSTAMAAEKAVRGWMYRAANKRSRSAALQSTKSAMHAEAINTELDRLDKMQTVYWDQALEGDIPSAMLVLRIIAQRCKLLGLETAHAEVNQTMNTLVVGGSEAEYIGALAAVRNSLVAGPGPAPAAQVIEAERELLN